MRRVALQLPDERDLGDTADLHDVVAYVEETTIVLRLHGIEPCWYHDCSDEPPAIGVDHILTKVLYLGRWNIMAAESRTEHSLKEYPPLIEWRRRPEEVNDSFALAA